MITLICGLPNAGKTTFSNRYENVVHFDECPMPRHEIFQKIVAEATGDVYAEGVCNSKSSRGMLLNSIKNKNEKKVCIWIDTPLEVCLKREESFRGRPLDMVINHSRRFEPPTIDEGWDEIIIFRNNYTEATIVKKNKIAKLRKKGVYK